MICSVEGCGRKTSARGLCKRHYHRWSKYGDPLGGGTFWGEPAQYIEAVVLKCESDECLIWPYARDGGGYGICRQKDGQTTKVSRYACTRVHGEPASPELVAAHSCGNGHLGCVNPKHLRWATDAENALDSIKHGTHRSILTADQVHRIRALRRKMPTREVASLFGVSTGTIENIHSRKKWAWLA